MLSGSTAFEVHVRPVQVGTVDGIAQHAGEAHVRQIPGDALQRYLRQQVGVAEFTPDGFPGMVSEILCLVPVQPPVVVDEEEVDVVITRRDMDLRVFQAGLVEPGRGGFRRTDVEEVGQHPQLSSAWAASTSGFSSIPRPGRCDNGMRPFTMVSDGRIRSARQGASPQAYSRIRNSG